MQKEDKDSNRIGGEERMDGVHEDLIFFGYNFIRWGKSTEIGQSKRILRFRIERSHFQIQF